MSGFLVVLLYLVAAAAALHAARRETPRAAFHESTLYLAAAALAAHAAWLADTIGPGGTLSLGLADSASLMGLAIGAGGLLAAFAPRFRTVAHVLHWPRCSSGSGASPAQEVARAGWPLAMHVVLAMGSAGMFAIPPSSSSCWPCRTWLAAVAPPDGWRHFRRSSPRARCSR
jgi:ABC-type uncharacterized transport system permease subunit